MSHFVISSYYYVSPFRCKQTAATHPQLDTLLVLAYLHPGPCLHPAPSYTNATAYICVVAPCYTHTRHFQLGAFRRLRISHQLFPKAENEMNRNLHEWYSHSRHRGRFKLLPGSIKVPLDVLWTRWKALPNVSTLTEEGANFYQGP